MAFDKTAIQKMITESGNIHELAIVKTLDGLEDRMYDYVINSRVVLMEAQNKIRELIPLLIECRGALPAISLASAKLRNIDLSLDKKIEDALKPWEITE